MARIGRALSRGVIWYLPLAIVGWLLDIDIVSSWRTTVLLIASVMSYDIAEFYVPEPKR